MIYQEMKNSAALIISWLHRPHLHGAAPRSKIRPQSRRLGSTQLARELRVVQPARVAEGAGTVRTSTPFGGLGPVAAVAAAGRSCFL